MEIGVFIPIGRNGWIVSTTSPQYNPSFELNKQTTLNAERYGFDFALSMIKLRGFGGESGFWDQNLESFTPAGRDSPRSPRASSSMPRCRRWPFRLRSPRAWR